MEPAQFIKITNDAVDRVGAKFDVGTAGEPTDSITDFLARPLKLVTFDWARTDGNVLAIYDLVSLYLGSTPVLKKLAGYHTLSANIRVYMVVTGSPFQYGKLCLSYRPGYDGLASGINFGGQIRSVLTETADLPDMIAYSQRPNICVYPTECTSGEMIVPIIFPADRLDRDTYPSFPMSAFTLYSPTRLECIGATPIERVTVQIYVSLHDVVLADRTANYQSATVQDQLEASGATSISDLLVSAAQDAKGETAESAGLLALGALVRATGFSNPHTHMRVGSTKPEGFPGLTSSDQETASESLSVVSNPTVVGGLLPKRYHDEMDIKTLGAIPSLASSFTWNNGTEPGSVLSLINVSPFNHACGTHTGNLGSTYTSIQFTPAAYFASLFHLWRGDVVYTFEAVASKMHRGQIRIFYDPLGSALVSDAYNRSCVWDISVDTRMQVRIPYDSHLAFKNIRSSNNISSSYNISNTGTYATFDRDSHMGKLTLVAHTKLSATMAADPGVTVLVTVHVENLELARPLGPSFDEESSVTNRLSLVSPWSYQSEKLSGVTDIYEPLKPNKRPIREYMGEEVVSLRALCHRSTPGPIIAASSAVTNANIFLNRVTMSAEPKPFGYEPPNAYLKSAFAKVAYMAQPLVSDFNFHSTPPCVWAAAAFAMKRGGYRWKITPLLAGTPSPHITVSKPMPRAVSWNTTTVNLQGTTMNTVSKTIATHYDFDTHKGMTGMAASTDPLGVVDFIVPYQSRFRASGGAPHYPTAGNTSTHDDTTKLMRISWYSAGVTARGPATTCLKTFVSANVDYDVFYFVNAPRVYIITGLTVQ